MKYYIIAGEASGDLHGSNLIKALRVSDEAAVVQGFGGDKMELAGMQLVRHYREMAFMGFVEVIKNLPAIWRLFRFCKKDIIDFNPDVLILIDYPGFNLRIAKWAKERGLKVVYYIVPQVWAWHQSRVHDLHRYTAKMLVILPFEKEFFARFGYKAIFTGHPLVDAIEEFRHHAPEFSRPEKPVLALLPGSRRQEVETMLPVFLQAASAFNYEIYIACAPSLDLSVYQNIIAKCNPASKAQLLIDNTYSILSIASLALVSSGTATLETALFGVPQVVCYKGNGISFAIARRLVKLKYISLVNLICDKPVVKELIQHDMTVNNICDEIRSIQNKGTEFFKLHYDQLHKLTGGTGASMRAASEITALLREGETDK
jgi:lipid-A-disaccharide synthase